MPNLFSDLALWQFLGVVFSVDIGRSHGIVIGALVS